MCTTCGATRRPLVATRSPFSSVAWMKYFQVAERVADVRARDLSAPPRAQLLQGRGLPLLDAERLEPDVDLDRVDPRGHFDINRYGRHHRLRGRHGVREVFRCSRCRGRGAGRSRGGARALRGRKEPLQFGRREILVDRDVRVLVDREDEMRLRVFGLLIAEEDRAEVALKTCSHLRLLVLTIAAHGQRLGELALRRSEVRPQVVGVDGLLAKLERRGVLRCRHRGAAKEQRYRSGGDDHHRETDTSSASDQCELPSPKSPALFGKVHLFVMGTDFCAEREPLVTISATTCTRWKVLWGVE